MPRTASATVLGARPGGQTQFAANELPALLGSADGTFCCPPWLTNRERRPKDRNVPLEERGGLDAEFGVDRLVVLDLALRDADAPFAGFAARRELKVLAEGERCGVLDAHRDVEQQLQQDLYYGTDATRGSPAAIRYIDPESDQ